MEQSFIFGTLLTYYIYLRSVCSLIILDPLADFCEYYVIGHLPRLVLSVALSVNNLTEVATVRNISLRLQVVHYCIWGWYYELVYQSSEL